ncbi:ABC transporter substrate-binding protein [Nocardioides psychrotolerans]|uniref:ABC transporter substrate-binding protein n=1 Tax=Nocardioides psychrotolerans TaxID=1005945 RepID=UPI0031376F8B
MARPSRDRTAGVRLLAVATLTLALAACGSQLEPGDVRTAGGTTAVDGTVPGADGAVPGAVVPGADPGAPDVPGTDPGATTPGGSTGGTGSTGGDAGGDTEGDSTGTGENAPTGTTEAGSCEGFDNDQTGVTADTITIANASDISGPVPGIFESAQLGTRAFAAYFNSTEELCGHKLEVLALDSRADAGSDQQAYQRACDETFAAVGSQSAFDFGGAGTAQACGLPDLRAYSLSTDRTNCTTCYAAYGVRPGQVPNAMPQFWVKKEPDAVEHVAMLYVNAGAAPENASAFRKAWEANGWNVDIFQGIDVSEFNYAPYVQQMKDAGIEFVNYIGPYQFTVKLQQAMAQQGFTPKVFLQDATIYDSAYVEQAGELGNGVYAYSQTNLFDDFSIAEMKLYRAWLDQVSPGAEPNIYGVYAWSAARLFVEEATKLGGKLTRKTLLAALAEVRDWTANGMHVPQDVGAKTTANCASVIQLDGGTWSKVSPGEFLCGSMSNLGS